MFDISIDISNSDLINITNTAPIFNSVLDSTGNLHKSLSDKDIEIIEVEQGVVATAVDSSFISQNFERIKAHSNPAFEGLEGTMVHVSKGLLNPTRHSAVRYEDNSHPKKSGKLNEGIPVTRTRKNGGSDLSARTSRAASNALKGCGSRFKTSGNMRSHISFSRKVG